MTPAERKEAKRLIRKAYDHNSHARRMASCNSHYMGSMAHCILIGKLGGSWPRQGFTEVFKTATDAQLADGLAYVQHYLPEADRAK